MESIPTRKGAFGGGLLLLGGSYIVKVPPPKKKPDFGLLDFGGISGLVAHAVRHNPRKVQRLSLVGSAECLFLHVTQQAENTQV